MLTFFKQRGYSEPQLHYDLQRVVAISRNKALSPTVNIVPLALTYHPFNTVTRKILVENFNILSTDPETRGIFPEPPLLSYRRDKNLRDFLIRSTSGSQRPLDASSFPCRRPRCQTCRYITSQTVLHGPKSSHTIQNRFTCQSEN